MFHCEMALSWHVRTSSPITVGQTTYIRLEDAGEWPRLTDTLFDLRPGWPSGSLIIDPHWAVLFFFSSEKAPTSQNPHECQ